MSSAKVQSPVPCRKRRREERRGGRRGEEGEGRNEEGKNKTEHVPADVLAHLQKNAPGIKESQAVLE